MIPPYFVVLRYRQFTVIDWDTIELLPTVAAASHDILLDDGKSRRLMSDNAPKCQRRSDERKNGGTAEVCRRRWFIPSL
jgi:hypothetical protein